MIVAGMIVGASGSILTNLMAEGDEPVHPGDRVRLLRWRRRRRRRAGVGDSGTVKATSAADAAIQMAYANQVIVVPGYGLAVAQAQHAVKEMATLLEAQGRRGEVRDPPGRRPHARAHERAVGRGRRRVRRDEGDGRHQRRVRPYRRRHRHRRERRHQPGGAQRRQFTRSTACRSSTSTRRGR